jgi:hypothetical protein
VTPFRSNDSAVPDARAAKSDVWSEVSSLLTNTRPGSYTVRLEPLSVQITGDCAFVFIAPTPPDWMQLAIASKHMGGFTTPGSTRHLVGKSLRVWAQMTTRRAGPAGNGAARVSVLRRKRAALSLGDDRRRGSPHGQWSIALTIGSERADSSCAPMREALNLSN